MTALDKTGLKILNFQQLLNQLTAKTQELFGDDVNTDQNSALGMYIRVISWLQNIVNQDLEAVYYSSFVDQAEGVSLDRLGSNYSVTRKPRPGCYSNA